MMKAPSFRPERTGPHTALVHYYSDRDYYAHYAMSVLKSAASEVFDLDIEVELVQERDDLNDHDVIEVTMPLR